MGAAGGHASATPSAVAAPNVFFGYYLRSAAATAYFTVEVVGLYQTTSGQLGKCVAFLAPRSTSAFACRRPRLQSREVNFSTVVDHDYSSAFITVSATTAN